MELVGNDYLERIHQDSIRILEEVGIKCHSPELRKILENTGMAAYDDSSGHIHILSPLVEQALSSAPGKKSFWVEDNSFGVGGTAPFVYDDEGGELRMPNLNDVARIAQIVNEAAAVKFMHRGVLVKGKEVETMEIMARYCNKPLYVSGVESGAGLAYARKLHTTRGQFTLQFAIINSPLNVIESMVWPFLEACKMGIPVSLSTMPMAGLSAPYSLSGLLSLTHAESLFGIVVAQLINPGMTVVHAGLPSVANIQKNYTVDLGLISHNLANLIMAKVCSRIDLPSIHSACTTSQEAPGPAAEQDAINGYALLKKYGFHQMRHAFGFLKELVSFSIAKLERHAALCEETTPLSSPKVSVDPYDDEGFDVIQKNGSSPNYMKDDHTLKNTGKVFLH